MSRRVRSLGNAALGWPFAIKASRSSAADRFMYRRADLSSGSAYVWGSTMARRSAASCGSFSFATDPAARREVLQAADPVTLLIQSLLDRVASPSEAALALPGGAAAQRRDHLGLERAALVSGEPSGPRANQGVVLLDGIFHHGGPARGEMVTNRPRSAHHFGRTG